MNEVTKSNFDEVTKTVINKLQLDKDVLTLLRERPEVHKLKVVESPDRIQFYITAFTEVTNKEYTYTTFYSRAAVYSVSGQGQIVDIIINDLKEVGRRFEKENSFQEPKGE
ncbi:MAG: hypothetical protein WC139_07065 [Candidatus Kapaibacterium sp.]